MRELLRASEIYRVAARRWFAEPRRVEAQMVQALLRARQKDPARDHFEIVFTGSRRMTDEVVTRFAGAAQRCPTTQVVQRIAKRTSCIVTARADFQMGRALCFRYIPRGVAVSLLLFFGVSDFLGLNGILIEGISRLFPSRGTQDLLAFSLEEA